MLKHQFTLSGGGVWHMTFVTLQQLPHSQSRVAACSVTTCLACYGYTTRIDKLSLRQYRACVVDSIGLGITCLISLYYVYKASQSCLS